MIVEPKIAAERAVPTLAVSIADEVVRERVLLAVRQAGFASIADATGAQMLVADAMTAARVPMVVIGTEAVVVDAFKKGAAGGLRPDFSDLQFERTVLAVAVGLRCFDLPAGAMTPSLMRSQDHALADEAETGAPLTARESEVMTLLTTGASNKQIARMLDISVHTAKFHVASIIAKLGARGRTDAVARALSAANEMI